MAEALRPARRASSPIFMVVSSEEKNGSEDPPLQENPTSKSALDLKLTLSFSILSWDVTNPNLEESMNRKEQFAGMFKKIAAGSAVLALLIAGIAATAVPSSGRTTRAANMEMQMSTTQSKFYC